jgi:NADPH:quinone reductase-like Zn-dependent oxidoreductase
VVLPEAISNEQGAMFFVNPLTAYVLIREVLRVPKGSWLLLTAAASALGKSVIRMSKIFGFKTLCVLRSDRHSEELLALGADAIVETDSQDLIRKVVTITEGKGVTHAMDCIGGELAEQVVRCLGLDGKLVLYGTLANSPMSLPIRDLMMPVAHISGFMLPNWIQQQSPVRLLRILRAVKKLMLEGVFDTEVSDYYPLEQVAAAVSASMQSGRKGKVMLRIGAQ